MHERLDAKTEAGRTDSLMVAEVLSSKKVVGECRAGEMGRWVYFSENSSDTKRWS